MDFPATAHASTKDAQVAPTWTRAASGEKAEAHMDDVCGLCPQRAVMAWWQPTYRLERALCSHHAREKWDAMIAAGWCVMPDDREPATT